MTALPQAEEPPAAERTYKNLQVLAPDTTRSELSAHMLANLRGLGLRRLAGEGCLFCHVGDLETPRSQWDYASDEKPMKRKARVMMAMVQDINTRHLPKLEGRLDPALTVTCTTCHAGRTDPRPLPDVLWAAYGASGIDGATLRYRELRERYFAADAYDFQADVLPSIALRIADAGAIDDAIALAALGVEVYPDDPSARQSLIGLKLERTIDAAGVEAALAQLDSLAPSLPPGVLNPGLLDSVAWRLNRTDRKAAGHALIRANHARYPGEYVAIESLAFILSDTEHTEHRAEALALLEAWLKSHPDHARARRLLTNLRDDD